MCGENKNLRIPPDAGAVVMVWLLLLFVFLLFVVCCFVTGVQVLFVDDVDRGLFRN